ncbi:MAG: hypothetical protein D6677_03005 [Calditrichaeota bacterium]|nr:MAG: hypothetical protein D6677_03005 [Calditrichota bacterium]
MLKHPYAYWVLFLVLACHTPPPETLTITGRLHTADNRPPEMAHIAVTPPSQAFEYHIGSAVHKDGTFEIIVPYHSVLTLRASAVNHEPQWLDIVPRSPGDVIDLEIWMAPYEVPIHPENVQITGDWNGFNLAKSEPMKRLDDGSFHYTVHADTNRVAFQIVNAEQGGRTINMPNSEAYRPDSSGDYQSLITLHNGQAEILFDPSWYSAHATSFRVRSVSHPEIDDIRRFSDANRRFTRKLIAKRNKWFHEHKNLKDFPFGADSLLNVWKSHKQNSAAYRVMGVKLLRTALFGNNKTLLQHIFTTIAPTDPVWEYDPDTYIFALSDLNPALIDSFYTHPEQLNSRILQAHVIFYKGMKAADRHNEALQKEAYEKLKNHYADINRIEALLTELNPEKAIQQGKPVPPFEVTLMHGDQKVSNTSMLGRYYLIDFWAVWCGPCRGEMPNLHKAYEKFKDKNLTILSLSLDPKPDDVDAYRKEKWAMPWLHAFLENDFDNPMCKRFEVHGIPAPLLIGPDGSILATQEDLRGTRLIKTLDKYLGNQ